MAVEVDDAISFEREVLRSPLPVLVDFWAPWCGPCRAVAPEVEAIERTHSGRLRVVKCNIDRAPDVAQQYRVMSIPMLALFDKGQLVASSVGAKPRAGIERDLGLDRRLAAPRRDVREVVAKRPKMRADGTY